MSDVLVVTGATGNVGSRLADQLLERHRQLKVRVVGRSADRLQRFVDRGAEPAVGSVDDAAFVERAFAGARAVFTLIPPDYAQEDFRGFQARASEAYVEGIRKGGVRHVVNLSSIGAEVNYGTGPILGLHDHEQRLNALDGVEILHLRPAWFMENLLGAIPVVASQGAHLSPYAADLPMPMIATRDIAELAMQELLSLEFTGVSTQELLGPRDYTMTEATRILGRAIGRPDLQYVQIPETAARDAMLGMGLKPGIVDLFLEMVRAMGSGKVRAAEPRLPENTTPTTLEEWAEDTFAPAYGSN